MIQSKKILIAALVFPILALLALTAYKRYVLSFGENITLPISGYDPRDLLAGHYLIYQIDYGVEGICEGNTGSVSAFVCLDSKEFSFKEPEDCRSFIRGVCDGRRFEAGIEKYFVPEDKAKELEQRIQSKTAAIVLSVSFDGRAQVKDLLIDGKSWKSE